MSGTNGAIPAGWYQDPEDGNRQRYWDGSAWTGHVHPPVGPQDPASSESFDGTSDGPAPAPASTTVPASTTAPASASSPAAVAGTAATPPKRRRRTGLIVGLASGGVAVVAVIALVVGFVVVPAIRGPQENIYTDQSALYDYTDPMLGLERDHEFVVDVDYDLEEVNAAHADDSGVPQVPDARSTPDWAIQVFYDSALTKPADIQVFQLDPGGDVTVSGSELGSAFGGIGERTIAEDGDWGMHEEYYLVNRVEKDGTERTKPLVTKFTVQTSLESPDVVFGKAAEDGTMSLTWDPVEGAGGYLVITHEVEAGGSGVFSVLAEVDGTEWSTSAAIEDFEVPEAPFISSQNLDLDAYSYRGLSQDEADAGQELDPYDEAIAAQTIGFDIGVIATDGQRFSPYTPYDLVDVAGWLPREVAFNSAGALKNWGASGYIEGIENVQKVLPFTSIDGRTRSTVAYLDESAVLDYGDRWIFALRGRNTQLGEWIPVTKRSVPDPAAAIAQYNTAALASAPTTGMPRFDAFTPPEDTGSEPVSDTPDVDYPVYGSTEFTKFLGAHLIAQTKSIDISAYVDAPGAPDPYDAIEEARNQNPYAFNISYYGLRDSGKTMLVTYSLPNDEAEALRAQLKQKVDEVVSAVVTDGMGDRDKVAALNEWLVSNAVYDDAAFATLVGDSFDGVPAGYEQAWNATGTMLQGIGVCASYSYAFNALANAAGVSTVVVTGDVFSGGPHAWNKVLVDGQWFAVDTTWNDGGGDPTEFLMIPDSAFVGDAARAQDDRWMIDSSIPAYATP